jgi:hypothetical protein
MSWCWYHYKTQHQTFIKAHRAIARDPGIQTNFSASLFRIIGNDLPPRHSPGQTLSNLKFILDHEPDFEGCEKIWILNRLVDPEKENAIIRLLDIHRRSYIRIPFDWDEYRQLQFRFVDFPVTDFFYSETYLVSQRRIFKHD